MKIQLKDLRQIGILITITMMFSGTFLYPINSMAQAQSVTSAGTKGVIESELGKRLADFDKAAYKKKNVSFVGGYEGQCTWYCLGRAYEKTGKLITVAPNAKKWLGIKLPKGAKVVKDKNKVRANAIAVVTNTKYGHVMYVEAVKDGYVYYTEANVPMDNKLDKKDGALKRQKTSDFTKRVGGYIYL